MAIKTKRKHSAVICMILAQQLSGCSASPALHESMRLGTAILRAQFKNSCCVVVSDPTNRPVTELV